MSNIIGAAILLFIVFSAFVGIVLIFPSAEELGKCYKDAQVELAAFKAKSQIEEWREERKCIEEKKVLNAFGTCYQTVNNRINAIFIVSWVDRLARYIAKVQFDPDKALAAHQVVCADYEN